MPPKIRVTKEMIIDTAFDIARREGESKITARRISEQLGCSTQPVLYHFASVAEIRRAVYRKADAYHSAFIMNMQNDHENPMLAIGLNYVRFAREESQLFRFLFQSDEFSGTGISELTDAEELRPVLAVFQQEMDISSDAAKEIFRTLFVLVHGYASLYANNRMVYDEKLIITTLTKVFYSALCADGKDHDEETG